MSPHEDAWREARRGFINPNPFTTAVYLAHVAGKTRLIGARSVLEALGVPDAGRLAALYAERKQKWLEYLIQDGRVPLHTYSVMCGRPLGCKRENEYSDGRIDGDHVSGLFDSTSDTIKVGIARLPLLLRKQRLPTIAVMWQSFTERADWPAARGFPCRVPTPKMRPGQRMRRR